MFQGLLLNVTFSYNVPLPYRYSTFLFQDYQQIVNTTLNGRDAEKNKLYLSKHEAPELQILTLSPLISLFF